MIDYAEISQAIEEANQLQHPSRAMRVVLECAHIKLLPWHATAMGIGASTGCSICPDWPTRVVVDIQETWRARRYLQAEGGGVIMNTDEYRCDNCGTVYKKAWSDEEAEAEYQANFPLGAQVKEERALVCDPCYNAMVEWKPPEQWEAEQYGQL